MIFLQRKCRDVSRHDQVAHLRQLTFDSRQIGYIESFKIIRPAIHFPHTHHDVSASDVVEIIGERADCVQDLFWIPGTLEFNAIALYDRTVEKVVDVDWNHGCTCSSYAYSYAHTYAYAYTHSCTHKHKFVKIESKSYIILHNIRQQIKTVICCKASKMHG